MATVLQCTAAISLLCATHTMRPPGASFCTSLLGMEAAAAPTWMASYCTQIRIDVRQHEENWVVYTLTLESPVDAGEA